MSFAAELHLIDPDPETWGAKTARLAALAQRGLPVPSGLCLTIAQLAEGMHEADLRRWVAGHTGAPLAVRSSLVTEDEERSANAGAGLSLISIEPDSDEVVGAVASLLQASSERERPLRSILVQLMAPTTYGGVAFTKGQDVVIEAHHGSTTAVTSGLPPDIQAVVTEESMDVAYRGALSNLQSLLSSVATLARMSCDRPASDVNIEWAWHGGVTYLLQARPVTAPVSWS